MWLRTTMRLSLIILFVFLVTDDGLADTSREDKIAHIIETMDFRGQIVAYKDEMVKRILEEIDTNPQMELDDKIKSIIVEESSKTFREIIDDYIDEIAEVYAKVFSDEDMDALYEFYRSPQGQSFGKKLPTFEREVFWIDARFLELITKRLEERITERMSEAGYD